MLKKIAPYLIVIGLIVCFQLADYFSIWYANFSINRDFIFGTVAGLWTVNILLNIIVLTLFISVKRYQFGIGLILAGSFSNLLDRIFYNGVIDYIHLPFNFPAFNIADISICFGAFLIILAIIFGTIKRNRVE